MLLNVRTQGSNFCGWGYMSTDHCDSHPLPAEQPPSVLWHGLAGLAAAVRAGWRWLRPAPISLHDGLAKLRAVREQIRMQESTLRMTLVEHQRHAQQYAAANQPREAKLAIRLQLMHDSRIAALQKTLVAIETHIMTLESACLNTAVVEALQHGSVALGTEHEDRVDEVLQRLEEQSETTESIMATIGVPDSVEDAKVEAELARLYQHQLPEAPVQFVASAQQRTSAAPPAAAAAVPVADAKISAAIVKQHSVALP